MVPHWDLGRELGIMDLDAAVRMSGVGLHRAHGRRRPARARPHQLVPRRAPRSRATPSVDVPYLVNRQAMTGTGQLPKLADDMYLAAVDDLFLIPTAEVSVTNIHREETLDRGGPAAEVLRLLALLPPRGGRRRQGHARPAARAPVPQGRDGEVRARRRPRGDELETPDRRRRGRCCRSSSCPTAWWLLATGDLSFAAAQVLRPRGLGRAASASGSRSRRAATSRDFQARRAGIRWKGAGGKGYVHTLNGSGLALPRVLVAVLENYQTPRGRVRVPARPAPLPGRAWSSSG